MKKIINLTNPNIIMNQLNLSNYNLNAREANQLAFELHKNLMIPGFVDNVMEKFGIDLLIKTKNSGIVSNIINYYIETKNTNMINHLITKIDIISDFKLMKRDYMNLICYFYYSDYQRAQMFFEQNIIRKKSEVNTCILQVKDINIILSNKLYKLLPYLSGLFISVDFDDINMIVPANSKLKKFTIKQELQSYLLDKIECEMKNNIKTVRNFYAKKSKLFEAIIDAGNIIHGRNGKISPNSVNDLENIIIKTRENIGEPIVIIHKRHFKSNPEITNMFIKTNTEYFQTPYNFNDDIFIMWFFVKSFCTCNIISNDKYRDHIFNYTSSSKKNSKINEFSLCEFSNVIMQQTLSYSFEPYKIQTQLPYSNCIQVIDDQVYIPHISKEFIKIDIDK